jgi:hypothetical protein
MRDYGLGTVEFMGRPFRQDGFLIARHPAEALKNRDSRQKIKGPKSEPTRNPDRVQRPLRVERVILTVRRLLPIYYGKLTSSEPVAAS